MIMDHATATREGCTERYLLGEMTEAERLDFEEHFFVCRECAEDLKTTVAFLDNARKVLKTETEELAVVATAAAALRESWWRRMRPHSAFAVAAVAAVVCVAVYQALVVVPGLRRELAQAEALQAVRWEFLSLSRGDVPSLVVSSRYRRLGLRLSRSSARPFSAYRCELRDENDRTVQSAVAPPPPPGEELALVLTLTSLQPGSYVIVVTGLDPAGGPATPELARYPFMLQLSEE